jgi:hypothetical protein
MSFKMGRRRAKQGYAKFIFGLEMNVGICLARTYNCGVTWTR